MSRETKKGIGYFPIDVDILSDPKIEYLEALHGNIGFSLYIKILCKIYQNGYYLKWREKDAIIFSKRNNFDINVTIKVLNDCINTGLFCKNLYDNYSILTSDAIQKRYFKAVEIQKKFDIISLNDNKSTQSKENKEKKRKKSFVRKYLLYYG